ncbi:MAG: CaiB/BaiF CoA transferase family protein [Acidimicrobiia bacterium]
MSGTEERATRVGPMAGVRVVEATMFAFAPAAGAVLADWGADVIKLEHPVAGDPARGVDAYGVKPSDHGIGYIYEVSNRNKRAVGLDLSTEAGHEVLMRLIDGADVFICSFMAPARRKLGIDVDDVRGRNPRIVYARATGHGPEGPDADKGGFDGVSYWARSGVSIQAMTPGDNEYPALLPGPGFGDIQSGAHLAGGIAAALFQRERTGEGAVVDVSLLGSGLWAMQMSLTGTHLVGRDALAQRDRKRPPNPIWSVYRTSDHRYVALSMIQSDRYWPGWCRAFGREDLIEHPRYATAALRQENIEDCVAEVEDAFGKRTLDECRAALASQDGAWSVVNRPVDALTDPQAEANDYVQWVDLDEEGRRFPLVPAPARIDEVAPVLGRAPGFAADTDEVLAELGYTFDELVQMKVDGTIT